MRNKKRKKIKFITYLVACVLIVSCSDSLEKSTQVTLNERPNIVEQIKTINLSQKYKLSLYLNTEFEKDSCYKTIIISKLDKLIFQSVNGKLFIVNDKSRPLLFSVGNTDIILLEFDDRPDKNKVLALSIRNGKVERIDTIPVLDNKPLDIDDDLFLEVYGTKHLVEAYCLNCDSGYYNPTLVYKITENGVFLDTANTIKTNKEFWGDFYGFEIQNKVLPLKNNK